MTAFEYNEKFKETCVELGATKAVTTAFKKGTMLLPEEFWETIIIIPSTLGAKKCREMFILTQRHLEILEDNGISCADPVFEFAFGEPRIIYAIFPGDYSFEESCIDETK